MTYVVGWSPFHRDAGAVELACRLASSSGEPLHVVTVMPSGWGGRGRRDATTSQDVDRSLDVARGHLDRAGVSGKVSMTTGKSVPQALLSAVKDDSASLLVLGSGTEAATGRIALSSKTSRLLHSSPVPVALAPRNHRVDDGGVERVTCAFRDEESSHNALDAAAGFAGKTGAPLRAITFGVEPRRMVPPEVSGDAAMVLDEWRRQAGSALTTAVARLDRPDVTHDLVVGRSWDDVLHETDWLPGDVLVVGSSSTNPIAAVFLGSSASKIVRSSPVPVVVMP